MSFRRPQPTAVVDDAPAPRRVRYRTPQQDRHAGLQRRKAALPGLIRDAETARNEAIARGGAGAAELEVERTLLEAELDSIDDRIRLAAHPRSEEMTRIQYARALEANLEWTAIVLDPGVLAAMRKLKDASERLNAMLESNPATGTFDHPGWWVPTLGTFADPFMSIEDAEAKTRACVERSERELAAARRSLGIVEEDG